MKKYALWALAVLAGLVVAGTFFGSYVRTAWHRVRADVKASVPIDFEIARIRGELDQIGPDMRQNLDAVARETVDVQNLKQDIADSRANLEQQKKKILTMKADLEKGDKTIVYGDREYPASRIREKLSRDFEAYKTADKAVQVKEKLLEQKEKALAAHKEQIAEMASAKDQLEVKLAQLEAEYQLAKTADTKSPVQFDGSRLAHIKDSVKELGDRIKVMEESQKLQAQFIQDPTIDVEQKAKTSSVVKDVDDYFGGKADKVADQK